MSETNPLAGLNAAELAALAKAQSTGVTVINKDGSTTDVSKGTPPAADAAAAAAAAAATAAKATSGDIDPKGAAATEAAAAAALAASKTTRPDNVPEKFWDAATGTVNTEALLKSYGELEKARTKPAESTDTNAAGMGTKTPTAEEAAAAAAATAAAEAAAKAAAAADPAKAAAEAQAARNAAAQTASTELATTGKISDETYGKLEKAGYPRTVVDEYVAGQKAQATLLANSIYSAAGDKASYDKMVAWGTANYTPAEQKAFNDSLHSGDTGQALQAVNGLKARFAAEFGTSAKTRIEGGNGSAGTGNAFQSQRELTTAMNDARYKSGDVAYHREVQARIQASQAAGIDIGIRIQR